MFALRNERITREYLSRFTDESLNAYGERDKLHGGHSRAPSILFPEVVRTVRQSWDSSEAFPVSKEILSGVYLSDALGGGDGFNDGNCRKVVPDGWSGDERGGGGVDRGQYRKGDDREGANDSVLKAVENAVLGTIESMKTNFNCKDRMEIFIDPDDCEEK